jgi:hypothetical protein
VKVVKERLGYFFSFGVEKDGVELSVIKSADESFFTGTE